jgi:manganese-dependent ADP-ribose/CDP-alcohol diphosphatase
MAAATSEKKDLSASENDKVEPLVSFGLITDIHYADLEDRWNFSKTFIRHYRNSLHLVDQACHYRLNAPHPIAFVLQLGDLIDGFCAPEQASESALKTILARFANIPPVYHLWGNHEFYNFTRNELLNGPLCSFDTKDISPCHYGTIEVTGNLRIIALDTYDLSLLGVEKNSERYLQALQVLREHNQNENLNDRTGLDGCQQRFIQLNGGLTQKQLSWLREQLTSARNRHEKVIIIGKRTLSMAACKSHCRFPYTF